MNEERCSIYGCLNDAEPGYPYCAVHNARARGLELQDALVSPVRPVRASRTPTGWTLELSEQAWVDLMDAVSQAIEHETNPARARMFRKLRNDLGAG